MTTKKNNIMRLYAYYMPEITASTHLINDLEKALVDNDFQIDCITPTPSRGLDQDTIDKYKGIRYEEKYEGKIRVHRFKLLSENSVVIKRMFRYLLLNIKQYRTAKHLSNCDVILAGSTPPTQGIVATLLGKKLNLPIVYIVQDIFPDSLVSTGISSEKSLLFKIGKLIEKYTYKHADRIIVICDEFKHNLIEKGVLPEKIRVIYNWINASEVTPISRNNNKLFEEYNLNKNNFFVTYAGNMGKAQDIDTIINVAKIMQEYKDIKFVLFGSGDGKKYYEDLIKIEKINNITILPIQSQSRVSEVYSLGNISIVSCKKGVGKTALPSKTWSIMATATAIVTNFDKDSELNNIINNSKSGISCESGNVMEIKQAILKLYNNRALCNEMGNNGREYIKRNLDSNICTKKYIQVLNEAISIKKSR